MHKPKRSKRLRKKLYTDEFSVFGFEVSCQLELEHEAVLDQLFDELIDLIEARGLILGGGCTDSLSILICAEGRYNSPTEQDIKTITHWFKSNPICHDVVVYAPVDLNSRH